MSDDRSRSRLAELLCELQFAVAEELLAKLKSGEYDARDVNNILKMLKDNNVQYDSEILKNKLTDAEKERMKNELMTIDESQERTLRKLPEHLRLV